MNFAILPSPEIWCRDDFPALCFWRKLYRCVEVGVERGNWSRLFLDRFPQVEQWWGVDDWQPYPEMPYDRSSDYLMAADNLMPHKPRAKLIRGKSAQVAAMFPAGSMDFVYIDAAHDEASVAADLEAWWPAVSAHGVIAGHDWTDQPHHAGVKAAVTAFARRLDLTVYITTVEGYLPEVCPSWYMYKSGMPGPGWRRC